MKNFFGRNEQNNEHFREVFPDSAPPSLTRVVMNTGMHPVDGRTMRIARTLPTADALEMITDLNETGLADDIVATDVMTGTFQFIGCKANR